MRDIDVLDSIMELDQKYSDAQSLLKLATCMGWNEERILAAVGALKEAHDFSKLKNTDD